MMQYTEFPKSHLNVEARDPGKRRPFSGRTTCTARRLTDLKSSPTSFVPKHEAGFPQCRQRRRRLTAMNGSSRTRRSDQHVTKPALRETSVSSEWHSCDEHMQPPQRPPRAVYCCAHLERRRHQNEHTVQRTWNGFGQDQRLLMEDRTTEREEAGDMSIKISLMDQSWRPPRANQPRTSSAPISKRSETHPLVSLFAFTSIARLAYHDAACVCFGPFCQLLRKSVLWPPSFGCCFPGSACHFPALSNNVLVLHHDLPTFLQPLSLCEAVLGLPNSPKLTATGGLRHAISVGSSRTSDPQLCPFSSREDVISRFAS